ncbi:MAG TPA: hypothetical protein VLA34_11685, partial [Candidatus Krumholzibacterium sp.]|nr:hypothetical protein [Candidatus Krumholzibacterium sp.]
MLKMKSCSFFRSILKTSDLRGLRGSAMTLLVIAGLLPLGTGEALAVIANPEPVTVLQPDGTSITIVLKGDEYLHWNEDETGYPVVRSADGQWWVYAKEELGILVPTTLVAGA